MIAGVFAINANAQFKDQGNNHMTVTIADSEDAAKVPFTVNFQTDKNLIAIEGKIVTTDIKLAYSDEDEELYFAQNKTLFPTASSKGKWNAHENAENEGYIYFAIAPDNPDAATPVTGEGELMTGIIDASGLADGEYKLTFKDVIFSDNDDSSLYAIVSHGAKKETLDIAFTVADGKVTGSTNSGVKGIVIDEETAQKGIYNIQGMKIRQTVPGRLYIVNGKKVIANEVISAE